MLEYNIPGLENKNRGQWGEKWIMPFSKQKSLVFPIRKGLVLVGVSFWFTFFFSRDHYPSLGWGQVGVRNKQGTEDKGPWIAILTLLVTLVGFCFDVKVNLGMLKKIVTGTKKGIVWSHEEGGFGWHIQHWERLPAFANAWEILVIELSLQAGGEGGGREGSKPTRKHDKKEKGNLFSTSTCGFRRVKQVI